jgi:hypothetical protein
MCACALHVERLDSASASAVTSASISIRFVRGVLSAARLGGQASGALRARAAGNERPIAGWESEPATATDAD